MQFNELNEVDLKLTLLDNKGYIEVGNLKVAPYLMREIRKYGYSKYMKNLQLISLSVDDFIDSTKDDNKKSFLEKQKIKLKTFDFYIKLGGYEIQQALLNAISMIFRTDDVKILDNIIAIDFEKQGILTKDEDGELVINQELLESLEEKDIKIVNRDNFDDIVRVVKLQNYLDKPKAKEVEENPADEETRKLMEHMKKMREKVEEKKKAQQKQEQRDADTDMADIISAVSSKSHSINKLNIWYHTLYQVYDEYARLELIDNYDFSIKAMMAGADIKDNLKHWSSKI